METLTCIALARELGSLLRDTYVQAIEQADAGETLMLYMKEKAGAGVRPGWLVISACGGASFVFFSYKKPEIAGREWPTPLSESLDRLLVRSVSHRGMDRSLKITFASSKSKGSRRELVLELFAAKPRAYLLDSETSEIIASFGVRNAKKSGIYEPASRPRGKVDPLELDAGALHAKLPGHAEEEDLVRCVFGVGRLVAREAMARAGNSEGPAHALIEMLSAASKGKTKGYVAGPSAELGIDAPIALAFRPSSSEGVGVDECATVNDAVRKSYLACRDLSLESNSRRKASQGIRAKLKRLARTRTAVQRELREAERARELRRDGELVLSNIRGIKKGASAVDLACHEAKGGTRRIVLNPGLTAADNAAAFFKKARKLEKKLDVLPRRIAELDEEEGALRGKLESIGAWRVRPEGASGRPGTDRRETKRRKWPIGISPRRFASSDGWTIYVGRNNKENDYLTFAYAKPNDFWFHAHGVPGSHVVLRREGRKANPSRSCIEEAAGVAAYFSKGRTSHTVAVIYTEKKYVRKPRKGKAGTALYSNEKTVMVTPKLPKEEDGD